MSEFDLVATLSALPNMPSKQWIKQHQAHFTLKAFEKVKEKAQEFGNCGDLSKALTLLDRAGKCTQVTNNPLMTGLLLRGRANVLERHERYEESLNATHQAVKIYTQHGTEFDIALARTIEVYVLGALERFDEAIELALWIRECYVQQDTELAKLGLAHVSANLGQIYTNIWRLEEAMQEHQRALQLYQQLNRPQMIAWTYHDMGLTAFRMDRIDLAEQYYAQARPALEAAKHTPLLIKFQFNLAEMHLRRGGYKQALALLDTARQDLRSLPDSPDLAFVNLFEAQVRRALNQTSQAANLLQKAIEQYQALDRKIEAALALREMGLLLVAENTPQKRLEGLSCLEQALLLLENPNVPLLVAWIQLEQGELLYDIERPTEAATCARFSHAAFEAYNLSLRRAQAEILLADCTWQINPQSAQQLYKAALNTVDEILPLLAARCWHGLGRIADTIQNRPMAIDAYQKAISLTDKVRQGLSGHRHQAGFLVGHQALVEELLAILHKQPHATPRVFEWVERSKSRVLADLLMGQTPDPHISPALRHLLEERERLSQALDQQLSPLLIGRQLPMANMPQRGPTIIAHDQHIQQSLIHLRQQIQTIEERIEQQQDTAHHWRVGSVMAAQELLSLLESQTLLIAYYTIKDQLHAITATTKATDIQITPLGCTLSEVMSRWQQTCRLLLRAGSLPALQARLSFFWQRLLSPLMPQLQHKQRLLFLPHQGLVNIPFNLLYDTENRRYLTETWDTFITPSMTVLAHCNKQPTGQKPPLLIGISGQPGQPGYLPNVTQEIRTLATQLPDAEILQDQQATLETVLQALSKRAIIHFASHAYYDHHAPLESGIHLAQNRWLRAADLYHHHGQLKGSTVVLSACEAGQGHPTGNELLGLTSAFLYAGASSVVAGLWHVDDAATSKLMIAFYNHLRDGDDIVTALHAAQLALLHSETYSHPYYWGAFTVTGHPRFIEFKC